MAPLLMTTMAINMLGAVTAVPAFYAMLRPKSIGRPESVTSKMAEQ
jgi:hypothetical protein